MASIDVAAAPEVPATTPVALHPLVLVNITDHFTRCSLRQPGNHGGRAVGVLLGQQSGRKVEIFTSYELLYDNTGATVKINGEFLKERREMFLQVFPDYDVVGWYTTGTKITAEDIQAIHKEVFLELNESAVVLCLDAKPEPKSRKLPVYILETRYDGQPQQHLQLAKVPYVVESEESERIGIETAMKVEFENQNADGAMISLEPQANRLCSAVEMLSERIGVVVGYLEAVEKGQVPPDYDLLRRISDVVCQLPHGDNPQLTAAMSEDVRDGLLITFLGVVAKGTAQLAHLSHDSAIMVEGTLTRKGARQQMMGM
jgi:COP9 signalosome complex subunit 6